MTLNRQILLWAAQRVSGAALGLCVLVHLGTILYAVRHGVSAAEILGRTRGNLAWAGFYALFIIALAVHAPLGLGVILKEWLGWSGRATARAALVLGFGLLLTGLGAVAAVCSA